VRIIGGRFKGRALEGPTGPGIRPTSDRLRESVFNILDHTLAVDFPETRVIDLFAGTGALGLEALSRGAGQAMFVDDGADARALLRANVQALGVAGLCRIFRRDATRLGEAPGAPFTLAFLDPPYGRDLAGPALLSLTAGGWLAPGALCMVEEAARASFVPPAEFETLDERQQGDSAVRFLRYRPD
jgi:16S rRNA (guanine966-N2)-methyltransferase